MLVLMFLLDLFKAKIERLERTMPATPISSSQPCGDARNPKWCSSLIDSLRIIWAGVVAIPLWSAVESFEFRR